MILRIGIIFLLVFFLGCVAPTPSPESSTDNGTSTVQVTDNSSPSLDGPGEAVTFCNGSTPEENEECFEDAFATCEKSVGTFWETPDGASLSFETQGLDESTGNCRVRVQVMGEGGEFSGLSANCIVPQSPAMGEHTVPFFDSYEIGMDTCTGSYVDAIKESGESLFPSEEEVVVEEEETPPAPPTPPVKEFAFTVNESGVVGTKEFVVNEGDVVRLIITVDTSDVSFNGEQVYGPPKSSSNPGSIFDAGHLLPGQTKAVEFTATKSFEFGVYWPGSSVLKGKGKITVNPN